MQVQVYNKTTNGLPDTTIADEPVATDVEFTHGALWGPKSARFTVLGGLETAFTYADQYLGNMVQIWSPDGIQVWEGYIESVSFGYGARTRTRSLEGYANLVRVHYTEMDFSTDPPTEIGKATPVTASATDGQAIYGVFEYNESLGGATATTASDVATDELNKRRKIFYTPTTGSSDGIYVECVGFYKTLFRQSYTSTTTGTTAISTIIQDILTAKCPFISTDYTFISSTGKSNKRWYGKYELAGEIIKRLVGKLSGYAFRLDFGRIPVLEASKRDNLRATVFERLDGGLEDDGGQPIPPWLLRPDNVLQQIDFVPSSATLSTAIEGVESVYLMETTYSTATNRATWKPAIRGIDGELEG